MRPEELQSAFLRTFEPERDALWRFIRAMGVEQETAKDMMSETILQAYEAFPTLRDRQAFRSFLFTIAHRIRIRNHHKTRLNAPWDAEAAEALPHPAPLPDHHADVRLLHEALARLPERMRETVVLFELTGLSLEDVRAVQGGTLSGVKSRLRRGREQLTALLTERMPAQPPHTEPYEHYQNLSPEVTL